MLCNMYIGGVSWLHSVVSFILWIEVEDSSRKGVKFEVILAANVQSWALSVFFNFFNNKKSFFIIEQIQKFLNS